MGKFAWLDRDAEFSEACACAHRYVEPFIQRAISHRRLSSKEKERQDATQLNGEEAPDSERYCFLNELVEESDPEQIRGQIVNILVAGRDTTASLLSSLFFTLSRRSDVMTKVRSEVSQIDGRKPTYEDIKGMKYLNWVIKETLCMYTVVPMNTRVANKDTFLPSGGVPDGQSPIYVHKGQMIVYQAYSLHRRRDLWGPDANVFRPERWYNARPGFEYLPFNAGPRICPGDLSW